MSWGKENKYVVRRKKIFGDWKILFFERRGLV